MRGGGETPAISHGDSNSADAQTNVSDVNQQLPCLTGSRSSAYVCGRAGVGTLQEGSGAAAKQLFTVFLFL